MRSVFPVCSIMFVLWWSATGCESIERNAQGYPIMTDDKDHEMVLIPAGTFQMGITEKQALVLCTSDDHDGGVPDWCARSDPIYKFGHMMPQHEVLIEHDFWMDTYEVTASQYRVCVEAEICDPLEPTVGIFGRDEADYYDNPQFDDYPVLNATWEEADHFCREWRRGRLPTEAEWEYAARGTDGRLWPWGSEPPTNVELNYFYQGYDEPGGQVSVVGSYPLGVSPFGLFDLAGNVAEWTSDKLRGYPGSPESEASIAYAMEGYVARGGWYINRAVDANSVARSTVGGGLRCVIDD
jgi:formylglycine-generating enzyme required for sulfatase activity